MTTALTFLALSSLGYAQANPSASALESSTTVESYGEGVGPLSTANKPVVSSIINGEEAGAEDFPMTGGIVVDVDMELFGSTSRARMFLCSSTLIAPDVVLLAAHCLDPDALTYGMGTVNEMTVMWTREPDLSAHDGSGFADWPADAVEAWDWALHPGFDLMEMEMGLGENSDIALLFLDEPVEDIEHAYLISEEEGEQLEEGNAVQVVGWGQQEATDMFTQPTPGTYLFKMQGESVLSELGDYEMQIGAAQTDTRKCHGDSGGPTFMQVDAATTQTMRLIGVTSHAYDSTDCAEKGGVDTRVDAFLDWIDAEMRSRCEDGSRSWCEEEGIVWASIDDTEQGGASDTGSDADVDTADGASDDESKSGCGCAQASSTAPFAAVSLAMLLGVVRRQDRWAK